MSVAGRMRRTGTARLGVGGGAGPRPRAWGGCRLAVREAAPYGPPAFLSSLHCRVEARVTDPPSPHRLPLGPWTSRQPRQQPRHVFRRAASAGPSRARRPFPLRARGGWASSLIVDVSSSPGVWNTVFPQLGGWLLLTHRVSLGCHTPQGSHLSSRAGVPSFPPQPQVLHSPKCLHDDACHRVLIS